MATRPDDARSRRSLLVAGFVVTILGVLHHTDHIIRGNHVGWPLQATPTPFTLSLLVYPFLIGGLVLTARNRVWAGYWLGVGIPILLLVVFAHFVPAPHYEKPADIYLPYADPLRYVQTSAPANRVAFFRDEYAPHASAVWGVLAVAEMLALVFSLIALILVALRVRGRSGRW